MHLYHDISSGVLSGGEKARCALAIFALVSRNLVLFDEPSNHCDDSTLEALVEAIKRMKPSMAVIVVSHNREFIESMRPTHTVVIANGQLKFHNRYRVLIIT